VSEGDDLDLDALFAEHRPRLARMVGVRLEPGLRQRLDVDDVVQEVYAEATARLPKYVEAPAMPFFLWLRFLCSQKIAELYRRHVGAGARDVRREVRGDPGQRSIADSGFLADQLSGHLTSPSAAAMREELREQLRRALDEMAPADREILVLRHYEQLTSAEAAAELGIGMEAARKRYVRALQRLKAALRAIDPR